MNRMTPAMPGQRGAALLIAVAALSLVAILGAVLLANSQAEIRRAERLVDRTEGDHLIEIAVATAWEDIVNGETRSFSASGTAETGEWSVVATPVDARWHLSVEATTPGDEVEGRIVVSRDPLMPYALLLGDASTGPLSGRVDGRVGITGDATFSGRSLGDVQELIGTAASCTGCDNAVEVGGTGSPPTLPTLPVAPCPDVAGTITGPIAGGFRYDCTAPGVTVIDGVVTADGTVVLWFGPDVELRIDRAEIHLGGTPTDFFIHSESSSDTAAAIIDSDLHGVLSIPEGRLTTDGFRWEGTVAAAELRTIAGSELSGEWSSDLESLGFGGWRIAEWRTSRS